MAVMNDPQDPDVIGIDQCKDLVTLHVPAFLLRQFVGEHMGRVQKRKGSAT